MGHCVIRRPVLGDPGFWAERVDSLGAGPRVDRFVAFLEVGATEGLFSPDVFADITLPHWRVQVQGAEETIAAKNGLHPPAGRARVEKVLPAERGPRACPCSDQVIRVRDASTS